MVNMAAESSDEILVDFMLKRSMNRSAMFSKDNYKERWFVLTRDSLTYSSGTLAKRARMKGSIKLDQVKTVETVEEGKMDEKKFVFQILHRTDKGDSYYTLYIVAQSEEMQTKWVTTLKKAVLGHNVTFLPKFHTGVWTKSLGLYNCCDQIDRNAPGCQQIPSTEESSTAIPAPKQRSLPDVGMNGDTVHNNAGSHRPVPKPRPKKEKKIYVAAYDYKPNEEGDLELIAGEEYEIMDDTRDHWWTAKNAKGDKGYIPANYVKKKFDLEIYEKRFVEKQPVARKVCCVKYWCEKTRKHMNRWYYKGVTRERSEAILKEENREGCFMVRDSSTPGMYTLSIFTNEAREGNTRHYHIKKNDQEQFYLAEKHSFVTIPDLIYYHKHNAGGIATRLRCPPARNKSAPVTAGFGHSKWELRREEIQIFEVLGSGCFGTVHKSKWNNRTVAVKMMKERTMSEDAFLEEAKTMTQLSHPNLVQLYGVVTKSKPLIIVCELMPYGSLLTYLKRHKARILQKIDSLVDICIQVCTGMEYLESRSFIHRDLAARNCLVGESQIIKVADFGLARYVIDDEYTSSTGTKFPVKWAPPEVLSYTRFSSKSDVWAFGILMWEVFTGGQMPYDSMRNADVVDFVCNLNKRLPKPTASTQRLYNIMLECWNKDADKRPSFVELSRILQGLMDTGNYPHV